MIYTSPDYQKLWGEQCALVANLRGELEDARMTLRDQFAMAAMQGILAGPDYNLSPADISVWSYRYADVMMKERSK